ncbi:hypothetical protein PanWU01x14_315070, partial [Parasponia andersonii]
KVNPQERERRVKEDEGDSLIDIENVKKTKCKGYSRVVYIDCQLLTRRPFSPLHSIPKPHNIIGPPFDLPSSPENRFLFFLRFNPSSKYPFSLSFSPFSLLAYFLTNSSAPSFLESLFLFFYAKI